MIKIYWILFSLSLSSSVANTQFRQHGLILPKDPGNYEYCCIYSPPQGFKIFNQPNGKQIGVLTRNIKPKFENEPEYRIFFVDQNTKTATEIEVKNFKEIGYEIFAITYFERRNGFVRIVNESVDYWISEKEISEKNFRLVDWQQFFIEKSEKLLGFYAKDQGLVLKSKPTTSSKSIIKLEGPLFQIIPTDKCNNTWTKVKVKKYIENPCSNGNFSEENIEFITEGWLETVSKIGKPNLWYYARGC